MSHWCHIGVDPVGLDVRIEAVKLTYFKVYAIGIITLSNKIRKDVK